MMMIIMRGESAGLIVMGLVWLQGTSKLVWFRNMNLFHYYPFILPVYSHSVFDHHNDHTKRWWWIMMVVVVMVMVTVIRTSYQTSPRIQLRPSSPPDAGGKKGNKNKIEMHRSTWPVHHTIVTRAGGTSRHTYGVHMQKGRGAKRENDKTGRDPQPAISVSAGIPYYH